MDAFSFCDKAALRAEFRARRSALSAREIRKLSEKAAGHMLGSALWRAARSIALYAAVRGETDTTLLLEDAWQKGKVVLLPVCSKAERGAMRFVPVSGWKELLPGPYGIPEPACLPGKRRGEAGRSPELFVLPGLAFDLDGRRLGQGGGYYDRLFGLTGKEEAQRVGFAYSFQIVERLPGEDWDVPVHALCTEKGMLWLGKT